MGRRIRQNLPSPRASRIRRVLIALLAVVYVLVGFGGEISCAQETLGIADRSISLDVASDKADPSTKKSPTVVDHCYTCAPLVIPVAVAVCVPASLAGAMSFDCSTIHALEARLLDTPPPKSGI